MSQPTAKESMKETYRKTITKRNDRIHLTNCWAPRTEGGRTDEEQEQEEKRVGAQILPSLAPVSDPI